MSRVRAASRVSLDTHAGDGQLGFSLCAALSGRVTLDFGELAALLQVANVSCLYLEAQTQPSWSFAPAMSQFQVKPLLMMIPFRLPPSLSASILLDLHQPPPGPSFWRGPGYAPGRGKMLPSVVLFLALFFVNYIPATLQLLPLMHLTAMGQIHPQEMAKGSLP